MKLTKAQALAKITALEETIKSLQLDVKELQSYVKELDKPKPIPFQTGDVFAWQSKDGEQAAVFATDHTETSFRLTGLRGNLAHPFSNSVMDRKRMEQYLANTGYIKIGKVGLVLDEGIYLD